MGLNQLALVAMRCFLLVNLLALVALVRLQAQPLKWQVGLEAQLVFARYRANDPGHLLKPTFSVPTATGRLMLSRSLNQRGLGLETGLGYRQIPQATALQQPFNGFSTVNGVGLWYVPLGLRQDLTTLLFARHPPKFRLALKVGILNQFAASEGVEKTTFGETRSGLSLSGHSNLNHRYSVALYTGIEVQFPIRRLDFLLQCGQMYGLGEILRTQISYQLNGLATQASISNSGSALGGIGVGIHYHMAGR